jgi:hypothetical protein
VTPAQEFLALATEFCTLVNRDEDVSQRSFVESLCSVLPRLYAAALALPAAVADDEFDFETEEDRTAVYARLSDRLGPANVYWLVLDPFARKKQEVGAGALTDDLGDIYWELREALADPRGEAAAGDWRMNFEIHWGDHVASAFFPLHRLLVGWDHAPVLQG